VSTELAPIPRTQYGAVIAAAAVASVMLGLLAARGAGGEPPVLTALAGVLGAGAALGVVPLLGPRVIPPGVWGLAVLGVSAARTLLALGAMLALIEVQGLERRPVVYGVLAGTGVMMIAEGAAAAWLLMRREACRAGGGSGGGNGAGTDHTPGARPEGGAGGGSRSAA